MPSLKNIQDDLLKGLMTNSLSPKFIKKNGDIDIKDRLQVHRDTILENFISSLRITYPGIWRLIGDDCARGAALAYSHDVSNITKQSKMGDFGDQFPEFLATFESTKHLEYLPDFAKLEWFRCKSYEIKNEISLPLEEIQNFFINGSENGRIKFNSSVHFLKSEFPLMNIQELLDNPAISKLDIDNTASSIVICRFQQKIDTLYLSQNQWRFLYDLWRGDSIGKAMDNFDKDEIEDQLPSMIRLMLSKQMIKEIIE